MPFETFKAASTNLDCSQKFFAAVQDQIANPNCFSSRRADTNDTRGQQFLEIAGLQLVQEKKDVLSPAEKELAKDFALKLLDGKPLIMGSDAASRLFIVLFQEFKTGGEKKLKAMLAEINRSSKDYELVVKNATDEEVEAVQADSKSKGLPESNYVRRIVKQDKHTKKEMGDILFIAPIEEAPGVKV